MSDPSPSQVTVPEPQPPLTGEPAVDATAARRRWYAMDVRPLRTSRDFRLLWSSGAVTMLGSLVTYVALPFQLKQLTGSLALAGLLGAVEVVPLIVFGLYGGALADAVDRRRMVLLCEMSLLVFTGVLLVNALQPHPRVWPLFVISGLFAVADSLQRPSLDSLIPRVVAHDELVAASALSSVRFSLGAIVGPAVGGLLVSQIGTWSAYAWDVATYVISIALLLRLRPVPASDEAQPPSIGAIREGLAYAWSRKDLLGTYAVDTVAMVFGFATALFPFVADALHAPWAVGLLYSAGSVGSLLVTVTSGWTSHVHRHGRAILCAAGLYGAAMVGFGLARSIWLALAFLVFAGGFDMISGLFRSAVWNGTIPDELRGRLAGIELLSYSLGPMAGNARAGGLAAVTSLRTSIVSGGLVCVGAVGVLATCLPALLHYDDRTSEHAVREREVRAARAAEA